MNVYSDSELPLNPGDEFLKPTFYFDFDSQAVRKFTEDAAKGSVTNAEKAVRLFYAVRDGIRYDPYRILVKREDFKASEILQSSSAYCVPKAIALVAAARAVGIPSAIGFADVRNHLNTEKLRAAMGTDVFHYHGYTALLLNGKWLRVTPAFNIELCRKFNVLPLEFDGTADALFHPYDAGGRKHMEYLKYHGHFTNFPYERLLQSFAEFYPGMIEHAAQQNQSVSTTRFEDETPI